MSIAEFKHHFSPWRNDEVRTYREIQDRYKDTKTENEISEIYLNSTLLNHFLHFGTEFIKITRQVDLIKSGNFSNFSDKTIKNIFQKLSTINNYDEYMQQREWFQLELKYKKTSSMSICDTLEDSYELTKEFEFDEW